MTDQPQIANQTPDQIPARDAPQDAGQASAASTPAPDAPKADAPKAAAPEKVELSAEINAEIEAAMADLEAESPDLGKGALAAPAKAALRGPRVVEAGREQRSGKVVSVGPSDVFIEFGPKELGVVDRQQFKEEPPAAGSEIEVVVNRFDNEESIYVCSLPGTVQKADWEMLQVGQVVEARVTGMNKGGLDLEVAGHRAFLPASQVSLDRIEDLSVFVGEKLTCEVQKIERAGRGNIVLSRRDLLKKEREESAGKLRETLQEGDTVEGIVRRIAPFGAFVDVGGVDGLVHISDLAHDRVHMGEKHVEKYLSVGQKIKTQVLKVDWDAGRISLGMKQLQADPFEQAASDVVEGAELSGRVTKILEFGCFIEVSAGVEGLCHISELEWRRVGHPSEVVKEDEVVRCKVLSFDKAARKLSLSIKALKEAPKQQRGNDRNAQVAEEILKETPELRRMREKAKAKTKGGAKSGLGDLGGFGGMGLGDLKL